MEIWVFLIFLISFLVTYFLTPIFIKKLKSVGIVGRDVHKEDKPEVAEMGGLSILFGFSFGSFFSILFLEGNYTFLFASLLTVLFSGLIGVCDDLFGIGRKIKTFLPVFASIPLVVTQAGVHTMNIPFIGLVDLGLIYPFILIPIAITVSVNAFNMLAGYNGLESGLGFISCFSLGVIGLFLNRIEISILMFAMAGSCLAFLKYNYYPAKIFPGDVGTFVLGSAVASAIIIGNIEIIGIVVLMPYIINGFITTFDLIRGKPIEKFSKIKNGVLVPPSKKYVYNLYYYIESVFKPTEKKLVWIIWSLEIISCVFAFSLLFWA